MLASAHAEEPYAYIIEFDGIGEEIGEVLTSASQLVHLQASLPTTAASLQARIEDDIPNLLKALQSLAYYNSHVEAIVDKDHSPIIIHLNIDTGPLYPFASFSIVPADEDAACNFPQELIDAEDFGIYPGYPAYPETILDAEDRLLLILENAGYPLASITKRDVIADQSTKAISVTFYLDSGPLAHFGETDVVGNKKVLPEFFKPKIAWSYGNPYNPCAVERTVSYLEQSGLFSSINITHAQSLDEDGTLPMHIIVKTAKARSVAFGIGYATDLGGGVIGEWEHRNLRGYGDKLSITANAWQIQQQGRIRYVLPDFLWPRQDLILTAEVEHATVKPYRELSFTMSSILERQITDRLRISYGGMFTFLHNTHTDDNGEFNLTKIPVQIYWNGANSTIEPTSGVTYLFRTIPTLQTRNSIFAYCTNVFTATAYYPLDKCNNYVLAGKATLGSIWGANRHSIPPSERFYAGSDTLLRGYHYLTVSPLNYKNQPIGGRSMMIYSLEARMRVYDPFGIVLFYDVGNVYSGAIPQWDHKILQSGGIGLRYHTPVGPIRLDIAFPFTPRRHLDSVVQVYFSIGQSF